MKTAVLLVSFGTSYREARESSLERIYEAIKKAAAGQAVYQAYTSGVILRKLAAEGVFVDTVQEALDRALADRTERLLVVPTHMIPGSEYEKMVGILDGYRASFAEIRIARPVLARQEDCAPVAALLGEMLSFDNREEEAYILMGHGTEAEANVRYGQMNEALSQAGFLNVRIASVEAKPDLEDAIGWLKTLPRVRRVILHPFMVVAGDHARNDMAGQEDSYVTRLQEEGYQVEAIVKGLGEYPRFCRLYCERLAQLEEQA